MIRLTAVLCAGLFVVLLIAGEDKGQLRQGLMAAPVLAQVAEPVEPAAPIPVAEPVAQITEAIFVPAQPVRVERVTPVPVVEPVQAEPQRESTFAVVTARSANVRSGPSTADAVVGRLTAGEEVLVVVEENAVEGWSLVRIEGDGVTGYVASRLLQPVTP